MTNEEILKLNGGKKFDIVLMNPPYAKNLHLKFLKKTAEIANTIVSIQPYVWLNKNKLTTPVGKYRETFNGRMDEVEYIDHDTTNKYFGTGNSIEACCIFTLKEHGKIDLINYGFDNKDEYDLYKKINIVDNDNILSFAKCSFNSPYGWQHTSANPIKLKDHKYFVSIYTWHGGKTCYEAVVNENPSKRPSMILIFNSNKEVKNFKNSLKTHFMDWYFYKYVVPSGCKIKNTMFRLKDYTEPVTDETFYRLFNLNKKEIKIIEDFKIPENPTISY